MSVTIARSDARTRTLEALAAVSATYGWQAEAIAQPAEAVAALLLDVRPRPGSVDRGRR